MEITRGFPCVTSYCRADLSLGRHLVSVPPGPHLLSDVLISSPILAGDRGSGIPDEAMGDVGVDASGSGAAAGGSFEFGVDPSLDPELAMVFLQSSRSRSTLAECFPTF